MSRDPIQIQPPNASTFLALSPCAAARQPERAPSASPVAEVPRYCDTYPDRCPCWQNPTGAKCACVDSLGRPCEAVPIAGICCVPGGSPCHAVEFAAECPPELDFALCDWGYATVDGNGQPTVECYDARSSSTPSFAVRPGAAGGGGSG